VSEQIPSRDLLRTALETADRLYRLAAEFFISVEGRAFPWGLTRGADRDLSEILATLRRLIVQWVAQRKPPNHVEGWRQSLEVESALKGLWCIENAITKRVYPEVYGADPDWQPVPYVMTIKELEFLERIRSWLRPALDLEMPPDQRTARELTDCESDCLEVIDQTTRRLHTKEVLEALREAGKIHGKSTVKAALARLVAEGFLTNPGKGRGANGFGRPGWDSQARNGPMV
jgi:hypothetical protein